MEVVFIHDMNSERPQHQLWTLLLDSGDQRGVQPARIYPDELPMFRQWLRAAYIPGQPPGYVRQLCTAEECNMVARAIDHEVKPILRQSSAKTGAISLNS